MFVSFVEMVVICGGVFGVLDNEMVVICGGVFGVLDDEIK